MAAPAAEANPEASPCSGLFALLLSGTNLTGI